jgi:hypothetical protein
VELPTGLHWLSRSLIAGISSRICEKRWSER